MSARAPARGCICERACPEDEPAIRALLHSEVMEGTVRLRMTAEPDFFRGLAVHGDHVDVCVLRDRDDGRVVGVALRAEKRMFVNGLPQAAGYLGGLRIARSHRGARGLFYGYNLMREWHEGRDIPFYLVSLLEGNRSAEHALLQGRCGLPVHRDQGALHTFAMLSEAGRRLSCDPAVQVRPADPGCLDEAVRFLQEHGSRRQFFPVYDRSDFEGRGLLLEFQCADLLIARRCGEIVGTLGLWNQDPFRQVEIAGYDRWLGALRPVVNGIAKLVGHPRLPVAGDRIKAFKLTAICVRGDDPEVFRSLLTSALELAEQRRPGGLVLGAFHERDPFCRVVRQLPAYPSQSRLYVCHWEDGDSAVEALDDRVPYVELGSL